jgi:Ca2+-binding EF-hand superfamily protein
MGCTPSDYRAPATDWLNLFGRMQLTADEVKDLSRVHYNYTDSRPGSVNIKEWMKIFRWKEQTQLVERIFWIADRDGNGYLNLYEFVVCVWRICVLGEQSLGTDTT